MGLLKNLIFDTKNKNAKHLVLPFLRSILHLNRSFSQLKTIGHCQQFSNALVFLENCFVQLSLRGDVIDEKVLSSVERQITQLKSGLLLKSHEVVTLPVKNGKVSSFDETVVPKVVLKGILYFLLNDDHWGQYEKFSQNYLQLIIDSKGLLSRVELVSLSQKMSKYSNQQLLLFLKIALKGNFVPKLDYRSLFRNKEEEQDLNALKFCFLCIQQPIGVLDKLFHSLDSILLSLDYSQFLNGDQAYLLAKKLFQATSFEIRLVAAKLAIKSKSGKSYGLLKAYINDPSKTVRETCLEVLKTNFQINLLLDESFNGKIVLRNTNFEEFASNLTMSEKKEVIFNHLKSRRDISRNKKDLLKLSSKLLQNKSIA